VGGGGGEGGREREIEEGIGREGGRKIREFAEREVKEQGVIQERREQDYSGILWRRVRQEGKEERQESERREGERGERGERGEADIKQHPTVRETCKNAICSRNTSERDVTEVHVPAVAYDDPLLA